MRGSLLDLREVLGENSLDFKFLQEFVTSALLNPSMEIRQNAIHVLEKSYKGVIQRGFVVANQVFVVMSYHEEPVLTYVCDAPQEYSGRQARAFDLEIA